MAVFGEAGSCGVVVQVVVVGLAAGVALGAVTGASAAPAAVEPIAAGASGADVGARPLVDLVWGFLLVLLALAVSLWGSFKHRSNSKSSKLLILLAGVFAPLQDLGMVIYSSWGCVAMVWKCHKLEDPEMRLMSFKSVRILFSLPNPWSKSRARILSNCGIVLYLPNGASEGMSSGQLEGVEKAKEGIERDLESPLKPNEVSCGRSALLNESWAWVWVTMDVRDESEAMVVGEDGARKCKIKYYDKKQLSIDGIVALVWGTDFLKDEKYNFLPDYDELKFLRGNSGFATIAIAIQAIGYIYAILFRSIKGLRVAPIEVIGLILNMILLVTASHYSTSNPCHRPLVIYMNEEREEKFLRVLKSQRRSSFDLNVGICIILAIITCSIIFVCLQIALVYYIVTLKRDIDVIIVISLVIFSIGIFGNFVETCFITYDIDNTMTRAILLSSMLLNGIAYSWANGSDT